MVQIRVALVFLTATLATVLLVSILQFIIPSARQALEREIGRHLASEADNIADDLARGLYERFKDMQDLAEYADLVPDSPNREHLRARLEKLQVTDRNYSWLAIVDASGIVKTATGGMLEGVDVSRRPWFAPALERPYFGDVHPAELLAKLLPNPENLPFYFIDIAFPIRDYRGQTIGVFCAHLNWRMADDIVGRALSQSRDLKGLDGMIVNASGQVLHGPETWRGKRIELPSLAQARAKNIGYRFEDWPGDGRFLVGYAPSHGYESFSGLGWTVLVRAPAEAALATIDAMHNQITYYGIGIGAVFILVMALAGHAIAKPIGLLAESAQRVRDNHLDSLPAISSRLTEIASLSDNFSVMAERVKVRERDLAEANRFLEDRVEERTRELAIARDAADRANRAKSEFLSNMSHELRTPLNAVLGFAQLLDYMSKEPLTKSQRDYVGNIMQAGQHLLTLINDVLDLARVEAGRIAIHIERINPGPIIEEITSALVPLAAKDNIRVWAEPGEWPEVMADRTRLYQTLLNLASNAVKYNRPEGSVTITAARLDANWARLAVIDTGLGIPKDRQGELFKPFSRLGAEASAIEGTGIGLALTRQLVEAMGGRLGFTSEQGRGSTFWIDLPIASENRGGHHAG